MALTAKPYTAAELEVAYVFGLLPPEEWRLIGALREHMGASFEEIVNLRWEDVDFAKGTINLREGV